MLAKFYFKYPFYFYSEVAGFVFSAWGGGGGGKVFLVNFCILKVATQIAFFEMVSVLNQEY